MTSHNTISKSMKVFIFFSSLPGSVPDSFARLARLLGRAREKRRNGQTIAKTASAEKLQDSSTGAVMTGRLSALTEHAGRDPPVRKQEKQGAWHQEMKMAHEYTVTTPHGDVNLTTQKHHLTFASVEEFLKAHQTTISNALDGAHVAVNALGLYLQHGRRGNRIK